MVACGLPVLTTSASGAAEIIKNPELIIAEDLGFDFMELQTAEAIPVIDISAWSEAVVSALDNRINLSHSMLRRVEEEIDIKIVAKRYANAINGY
jgi:glycosyltransferase involved in cell wall biosynthesis